VFLSQKFGYGNVTALQTKRIDTEAETKGGTADHRRFAAFGRSLAHSTATFLEYPIKELGMDMFRDVHTGKILVASLNSFRIHIPFPFASIREL